MSDIDLITIEQWRDLRFVQDKLTETLEEKVQLRIEWLFLLKENKRLMQRVEELEYIVEEHIQYGEDSGTLH